MKKIICGVSVLFVAACGGGNETMPFVTVSNLPDGTTTLNGKVVTANMTNASASSVTVNSLSTDNSASLAVTRSGGTTVAISAVANGSTATVDTLAGGTITGTSLIEGVDASGDTEFVIIDPSALSMNYQNYGFWGEQGSASVDRISFGAFGSSANSLPSGGATATYTGKSVGMYVSAADQPFITSSDVSVNTDFINVTVDSSSTKKLHAVTALESSASNLDFTSTSTVSGTSFSGTVTGGDVAGTVSGEFYGPSGVEVGGVFSASGSGGDYFGAFGAK